MTRDEAIKWLERIKERYILCGDEGFDKARKEALNMAIEALERKCGEWVDKWHTLWKEELPVCSVCNNISVFKSNYCPNCGSRMDERSEDAEAVNTKN